ncbi:MULTISPECIES: hypothetical protein [Acidiphilium]|uniref:hypothetical protein n=1 Tax=Acidiphilium TaxID=522 RepID=UPI001F4BF700|nr:MULTISPECIES: hypothetical protein [Acidiphilium]
MTEPVTPGTALVAMPVDHARLTATRDQLSTDLDSLEFAMHNARCPRRHAHRRG